MAAKRRVAIIGAGVSGLTCAVVLQSDFHVTVFAKDIEKTTGDVAGAIWYPYNIEPKHDVDRWGLESYNDFRDLANDLATGVSMVEFCIVNNTAKRDFPDWSTAMQRRDLAPEESKPYRYGFAIMVPLIETPIYMPWLRKQVDRIEQRTIASFDELTADFDLVVNCAGLGARQLCDERNDLHSGRGVLLIGKIAGRSDRRFMVAAEVPNELTYILTRRDDIVLGGTDELREDDEVSDELKSQIYARCVMMDPTLPKDYDAEVFKPHHAFRPERSKVRLAPDADPRIIHNYGHGGAGFTVSWGCAREVARLASTPSS